MMGHFSEVCKRSPKMSTDKFRVIVLGEEEILISGINVDRRYLVHIFKFNLGFVLDKYDSEPAKSCRKGENGRKIAGAWSDYL